MPQPTLSLVIPAYNEEEYLPGTLENVARAVDEYEREGRGEVEIVVVDNNSSDDTALVAGAAGARVVFEPRNQIAAARNAGARAARGEVLAFLDADDHISPNLLCLVHEAMASGRFIGGGVAKILRDRRSPLANRLEKINDFSRRLTGVSAGLIFTSRRTFDRLGGFDESYYAAEEGRFIFDLRSLGRGEGKRFRNIREGHVRKSVRKFEELGSAAILWTLIKFLACPWKVRQRRACRYWYPPERRAPPAAGGR